MQEERAALDVGDVQEVGLESSPAAVEKKREILEAARLKAAAKRQKTQSGIRNDALALVALPGSSS